MNDAPTVGNASYLMTGNVLSGTLMVLMGTLSGSDIEGAVLTFTGTTASTGALTITSTGGFSYTPPNSFVGSATFTYQADDGSGGISSA